jgi:GR25 family glycosyltransferase involved in LPS biosynthesis
MQSNIKAYILFSKHEPERTEQVGKLQAHFPNAAIVEPIFPKYEKVPFLNQLIQKSKERTGRAMMAGEIGCLLGHRKIWRQICNEAKNEQDYFLIVESDSKVIDIDLMNTVINNYIQEFDIFFFGAWDGNVRIKQSTRINLKNTHHIGTPLIKSLYGTYGYALNKKAAMELLHNTKQISYPVDYYKRHLSNTVLRMGAIRKELISTWRTTQSNIANETVIKNIKKQIIISIFDCRNLIQSYFC